MNAERQVAALASDRFLTEHPVFTMAVFTSRRRRPLRMGDTRIGFLSHPVPCTASQAVERVSTPGTRPAWMAYAVAWARLWAPIFR